MGKHRRCQHQQQSWHRKRVARKAPEAEQRLAEVEQIPQSGRGHCAHQDGCPGEVIRACLAMMPERGSNMAVAARFRNATHASAIFFLSFNP
jgi:hypothetical protein